MPRRFIHSVLPLVLLTQCALARAQGQTGDGQVLTNASVIKLARGGFSDKAIVAIINSRPAKFDLATERLIELKKAGVSEKVILAMLGRGDDTALSDFAADSDFDSDPFFKDMSRPAAGNDPAAPQGKGGDPGEVNIFGSSGGARGRTRSRGGNGSLEDDTQTVGSASVRIIRPPAEAGRGGAPKLEKTPTLTNESVVLLVEAGFSEGTIIRRIEQSPVEFDLSDGKVAELRRRRVTDPIIAAMRAAMGDETPASAQPQR